MRNMTTKITPKNIKFLETLQKPKNFKGVIATNPALNLGNASRKRESKETLP